jgi:hypothetical protein
VRSPAIGLSDATIYMLRWNGDTLQPLWPAVENFKRQLSDLRPLMSECDIGFGHRRLSIIDLNTGETTGGLSASVRLTG